MDDRGTCKLKWLYTYVINPEQSNPFAGLVEAYKYGVPINVFANATIESV